VKADALFKLGVRAVSSDKAAVKLGGITVIRLHGHPHFQTVGFYFYLFNYYLCKHLFVRMGAFNFKTINHGIYKRNPSYKGRFA
jgi:hypothetical protein